MLTHLYTCVCKHLIHKVSPFKYLTVFMGRYSPAPWGHGDKPAAPKQRAEGPKTHEPPTEAKYPFHVASSPTDPHRHPHSLKFTKVRGPRPGPTTAASPSPTERRPHPRGKTTPTPTLSQLSEYIRQQTPRLSSSSTSAGSPNLQSGLHKSRDHMQKIITTSPPAE